MKIAVIYGTEHRGSTYNIVQLFLQNLNSEAEEINEFFLPKDMPHFCCGCSLCFMKGEEFCPHHEKVSIIEKAMERADLLIFSSPVYVYHATGQMKTLLDHFGYQWMVHRPNKLMFSKMALVVSTAAGAGMKSTVKDITDSLDFWGVAKVFKYKKAVAAINWDGVNEKKKEEIAKDVKNISSNIIRSSKNVKPCIKVKTMFNVMRIVQKKGGFNQADSDYWKRQGWLESVRPW